MPLYSYECLKERGGCSQTWKEDKPMHDRQNVMCPNCMSYGVEKPWFDDQVQQFVSQVTILPPKVNVIHDIDHQEGRTGDKVDFTHVLGPGAHIGSRRDLEEAKKRVRERLYEMTNGDHPTLRPYRKDPNDPESPVEFAITTRTTEGYDMGELVPMENNPERANSPKNPYKEFGIPGETVEEAERLLTKRIDEADKVSVHTPKEVKPRGRPKGSKNKKKG